MADPVTARDVDAAAAAIAGHVVHTPLVTATRLSEQLGCEVRFKLESLQMTGSFKDRGACHKLQLLARAAVPARGVVAASAGNHAQGVAWHARRLGLSATIVMPQATPFSKVERTESHGAQVVLHGESLAEAQDHALGLAREGIEFVHPYDDPAIVAGQGTVAREILADWPAVDCLVVPIGGGGLIAGMALCSKAQRPQLRVVGVQTTACPAMHAAVRGDAPPQLRTLTLADGIAVKRPGRITTPLIARLVDDIVLVDEPAIERAVQLLASQQKIVAEGAGACAYAALLDDPASFVGKHVAVVVSGGNIDRRMLSTVLLRGLAHDGKIARLRIEIEDVPGVLARVTRLIGDTGADIIDITHERTFTKQPPRCAELDVTCETRGRAHVEALLALLHGQGFRAQLL